MTAPLTGVGAVIGCERENGDPGTSGATAGSRAVAAPFRPFPASVKACRRCGDVQPVDGFYRRADSRDGRQSWCKNCAREARRPKPGREPRRAWSRARNAAVRALIGAHRAEYDALFAAAKP